MSQKFKKTYTPDQVLEKLKAFCAYQERCHKECRLKIIKLGIYGDELDIIISQLIQENYLNETRFATSFARGKYRFKKWSKYRITNELKSREISSYNIKKGIEEIDDEQYFENIKDLIDKKKRELSGEKNQFVFKQKIKAFLMRKGYRIDEFIDLI